VTALRLLAFVVVDGLVIATPMVAGSLLAVRLRVQHPLLVIGAAIGALAAHGSIVFWAYYVFPDAGRPLGIGLLALEVITAATILARNHAATARTLAMIAVPVALVGASALFALSLGFLHGGAGEPLPAAASRFLAGLPGDNTIPLTLAQAVERDARPLPDPLYANWSASDRPPLQTGIYLAATSIVRHESSELQYAVVGSLVQSLWILGLWGFLLGGRVNGALAAVTVGSVLFSGFVLMNTFYVWPKLLSAAFLLVVAAAFLSPRSDSILRERGCGVVLGLNVAGALLAHGGAMFALVALVLFIAASRRVPPWRVALPAATLIAALVGPWWAYQKIIDPPGDKLLKLNVAGIPDIETPKSFQRVLVDHYRAIGPRKTIDYKLENLAAPFSGSDRIVTDAWRVAESYAHVGGVTASERGAAIIDIRLQQFFRLVPALGLLSLGPVLVAVRWLVRRRRGRPSTDDLVRLWVALLLFIALSLATWSLVMFGPGTTLLHQGTYLTPLLASVLCVISWWAIEPRLTIGLVGLQGLTTLYLYKDQPFNAPRGLFDGGLPSVAVLLAVSFSVIVALLIIAARWARFSTLVEGSDARIRAELNAG
jgi:hypothetical protein